jgi:thymidylate synthase (FAD)
MSPVLIETFVLLAAEAGYDGHIRRSSSKIHQATAYPPGRTTIEARKQYFGTKHHSGKVYCTTTSTGFLAVRGNSSEFGFICGNSTPFEMAEMKFHIRIEMDTWRQMVRHRTASINEYSTRYSEAIDECHITEPDAWRVQSTKNKQGSDDEAKIDWPESDSERQMIADRLGFESFSAINVTPGEYLSSQETNVLDMARAAYEERLRFGVAREQARKDLPLSTYTEVYWKMDLHNLFHFLALRLDSHAQLEIRRYARAIADFVKVRFPISWEAFEDYRLNAVTFSKHEIALLGRLYFTAVKDAETKIPEGEGLSEREKAEFWEKYSRIVSSGIMQIGGEGEKLEDREKPL